MHPRLIGRSDWTRFEATAPGCQRLKRIAGYTGIGVHFAGCGRNSRDIRHFTPTAFNISSIRWRADWLSFNRFFASASGFSANRFGRSDKAWVI